MGCFDHSSKYEKKRVQKVVDVLGSRYGFSSVFRELSFAEARLRFFLAPRSRNDRGQTRSRGPDPVCLDPFRRPLRPCRGGHTISRSRGSITKVGTHFHVAATRRTGYLFFSLCPFLSPTPCFAMFSLCESIDFISRKSLALVRIQ